MLGDLPRFHALVLTNIELFWKWRAATYERDVGSDLFEYTAGREEVLRAPAAHGVSSFNNLKKEVSHMSQDLKLDREILGNDPNRGWFR